MATDLSAADDVARRQVHHAVEIATKRRDDSQTDALIGARNLKKNKSWHGFRRPQVAFFLIQDQRYDSFLLRFVIGSWNEFFFHLKQSTRPLEKTLDSFGTSKATMSSCCRLLPSFGASFFSRIGALNRVDRTHHSHARVGHCTCWFRRMLVRFFFFFSFGFVPRETDAVRPTPWEASQMLPPPPFGDAPRRSMDPTPGRQRRDDLQSAGATSERSQNRRWNHVTSRDSNRKRFSFRKRKEISIPQRKPNPFRGL